MQTQKSKTTLVENSEEDFEFSPVSQLDGDRFVSNVRNNSHEQPEEHVYSVFFNIEHGGNGEVKVHATECGCPSDEYHAGACKHRKAAEESTALRGEILGVSLGIEGDNAR